MSYSTMAVKDEEIDSLPDYSESISDSLSRSKYPTQLTPKQRKFVAEYLIDLNATRAAISAGYSEHTARQIASRLLTNVNVKAEVRRQYLSIFQSLGVKAQRILLEMIRIGLSDIRLCFDRSGNLLPIHELPDEIASAISSVEVIKQKTRDGEDDEYLHKVKLWDKPKALAMLGKHFGILKEAIEVSGPGGGPLQIESNVNLGKMPLWLQKEMIRCMEAIERGEEPPDRPMMEEYEKAVIDIEKEQTRQLTDGDTNE